MHLTNFLLFHIKKMSEKGCTAFVDNFLLQNEILSKSKGFAPDPIPDQTNQDASTENMFDAIIVPSLKGASSFIQQILALQPLIVDPGKSFLDGVIGNFLCNDESFGEKPALPPGVADGALSRPLFDQFSKSAKDCIQSGLFFGLLPRLSCASF